MARDRSEHTERERSAARRAPVAGPRPAAAVSRLPRVELARPPPPAARGAGALLALAAACALSAPVAGAGAPREPLAVAAAASLKGALGELERAFEAERAGVDVTVTLGASGALYAQLRNGAPFDVFLSADREAPAKLVAAKLAGEDRLYAIGRLVAWTPAGSRLDLARGGLAALADPRVRRIAIPNPAVAPFGRAAVQALRSAGVYDAVRDRLVLGTSAGQAAQFATTGAADVALLPASLAREPALGGGTSVPVPEALHARVEQSAVVLAAARDPALAGAFLAFVLGEKGRAILAKYGYGLP